MAATIEVKYFNTFWVKKLNSQFVDANGATGLAIPVPNYPGLPFKKFDTNPVGGFYSNLYTNYANANDIVGTTPATAIEGPGYVGNEVRPDVNYQTQEYGWLIEEARIKGGYNNNSTDYGVKAYLIDKNYLTTIRKNSVIYSGLFNSNTNVNETNVFSTATPITFTAPPEYGSIQKLYASDTKLHIFQQNKVSRALIDKDAIYSAEGQGTAVSTTKLVIGEINPYVGEYGISNNPESWAQFGNRQYFSDKFRNSIMRLSNDGLTPISKYGMNDFFRDELNEIEDGQQPIDVTVNATGQSPAFPYTPYQPIAVGEPYIQVAIGKATDIPVGALVLVDYNNNNQPINTGAYVTYVDDVLGRVGVTSLVPDAVSGHTVYFRTYSKDKIIGAYDNYNDTYMLSMQKTDGSYNTLSFDESAKGWGSFFDYKPLFAASLFNRLYTTNTANLWVHNSENVDRNSFYGATPVKSSIEFIFNDNPNIVKVFKTVNYEGTNGWEVSSMISDTTGSLPSPSFDPSTAGWTNENDAINTIKSYVEGAYIENGIIYRAGFNLKENRYVANVINNTPAQIGEVIFGAEASGIKGYFTIVKVQTDETTAPGQMKELYSVGTDYVLSSY
jgi:hypothetical protein